MKRIAIIADPIDNQYAGVHVYTKEMVLALVAQESAHQFILFREKKDDLLAAYPNVKTIVIPNFIGFTAIRKFLIIPFLARKYQVDMVIEPAHFGPFLLPKKIKRVTVIHDLSAVLFPQWHSFYSSTLQRLFLKRILRKADLIISNSQFTSEEIIKHYPFTNAKIATIYPGIRRSVSEQTNEIDIDFKPFFLYVGTVEPRKNLTLLLEAFQLYKEQTNSNIQLYIVGARGWKVDSFFERLARHSYKNDIQILGFVSNDLLRYYYQHCEAFIYPSQYEGFGFPVLEAMQEGATCITTAESSMSEISYPYALYFQNNVSTSLLNAMYQVPSFKLTNSVEEIQLHIKKYSWNNFAKEFLAYIDKLYI
ncbi:MAG: glycosyltransferase family 1 protein [Bacteroidota bacterium]